MTDEEEKKLVCYLQDAADIGYGKTRKQVQVIVEAVAKEKGLMDGGKKISDGWWRRFKERQSSLSLRKGDSTAAVRLSCTNAENLKQYFSLLGKVLTENDLLEKPAQLYNMDETGMPIDHKPPNVIAKKGQKKVRYRSAGNKSQVTVVGCVSAVGQAIPPMVIFDAKTFNSEWSKGEVPATMYGLSPKGWIDAELFKLWLEKHFLKHAVSARPLLLLLDGHSSHYRPDTIELARQHDIIMFCLPPHTTHACQPLDVSVYRSLKSHWTDVCHGYLQKHPARIVTKFDFSALLADAWSRTMTHKNICSGFRKCGVYPFDPNAIELPPDAGIQGELNEEGDDIDDDNNDGSADFTPEEEGLFQRRFEEGFDVFEPRYCQWLRQNHPEADVPSGTLYPIGDLSDAEGSSLEYMLTLADQICQD